MYCKYCGTKLLEDAAFCHECGKATVEIPVQQVVMPMQPMPVPAQPMAAPVQPVYSAPAYSIPPVQQPQPQYTYTYPPVQPNIPLQPTVPTGELAKLEKQALTLGIVGLCLSSLGLPGLIISCIGAKKAGRYKALTGNLSGKARTGYKLAKAGRIVGIISTVFLFLLISAIAEGEVYYDFDYLEPYEYFDY